MITGKIRIIFPALVALMTATGSAMAVDELPIPPASAGLKIGPKQTEATVVAEVKRQTTVRFEQASGGKGRLLTQEQAKAAGWGFVSDNFALIDRDRDGFVKLDDVLRYMAARSPQNLIRAQAASKK